MGLLKQEGSKVAQLLVRPQGADSARPGYAHVAFVGVVDVPNDHALAQKDSRLFLVSLSALMSLEDHSEEMRGADLGYALTQPYWRKER